MPESEARHKTPPDSKNSSLCILVSRLPDQRPAVTVLNFGRDEAVATTKLLPVEVPDDHDGELIWTDLLHVDSVEPADRGRTVTIRMPGLSGMVLLPREK